MEEQVTRYTDAYSKFMLKKTSNVKIGKPPDQFGLCGMKNYIIIIRQATKPYAHMQGAKNHVGNQKRPKYSARPV